jgi:F0F1-type ATP synthase delta subunit
MKFKLVPEVASTQDLKSLINEIKDYAKWFEHNAIKQRVGLTKLDDAPELSPAATSMLKEWTAKNPLNRSSLSQLTEHLERFAHSTTQVTITLAAPPTRPVKQTLVTWCRENLSPEILINFEFSSMILGGMVFRIGSQIYDWSFRSQILESSNKFTKVLRNV